MATVKCGAQICHGDAMDNVGTLGCVVRSRADPNVRYILTAAHVIGLFGYAKQGEPILAFVPEDNRWIKIAEFERAVRLHDAPGATQTCDAAIARITDNALVSDEIDGIGAPQGIATGLWPGMRVQLRGAGSNAVVQARVESTGNAVPVIYEDFVDGGMFTLQLDGQVLYGRQPGGGWATASQPGDSGALVLDMNGLAVGLHVGRTPDDYEVNASVCTPLEVVLNALDVVLSSASTAAPAPAAPAPTRAPAPSLVPAARPQPRSQPGTGDDDADDRFGERSFDQFGIGLRSLLRNHQVFGGSAQWRLQPGGLEVDGQVAGTGGKLVTVPRVWSQFGDAIVAAASRFNVPVELIVATLCTETSGNPNAVRIEPGWQSDTATPGRVSAGLMQTLISTARSVTGNASLTRQDLLDPATSIQAGTAYIDQQRMRTRFDPPVVACAYNAGGVYQQEGAGNRWRMRQYPIGSGQHADRFVQWFNDCFAYFSQQQQQGQLARVLPSSAPSLWRLFWS